MKQIFIEQMQFLQQLLLKHSNIPTKLLCIQLILFFHNNRTIQLSSVTYDILDNIDLSNVLNISTQDVMGLLSDAISQLSKIEDEEIIDDVVQEDSPANFKENVDFISKQATKNDKMSWWRLDRQLKKHLLELEDLNTTFFEFQVALNSSIESITNDYKETIDRRSDLLDHIDEMTIKMRTECIHPSDHILFVNGSYVCKFCNNKINVLGLK